MSEEEIRVGYEASVASYMIAGARLRQHQRYMAAGVDAPDESLALVATAEPDLPPPSGTASGRARPSAPYSITGIGLTEARQVTRAPSSSHDDTEVAHRGTRSMSSSPADGHKACVVKSVGC